MWESPINILEIQEPIIEQFNKEREEMVFSQIWKIGIEVDKEELVKALMYDRNQYDKGYKDGYNEAIDELVEKLATNVESFEGVVNGIRASLMTEDYFHEYVWEIAEQMKKGV